MMRDLSGNIDLRLLVKVVIFCISICAVNPNLFSEKHVQHEREGNSKHLSKRFLFDDDFELHKQLVERYLSVEVVRDQVRDIFYEKVVASQLLKMTDATDTQVTETFMMTPHLILKDVLYLLGFVPLLYRDNKQDNLVFQVPINKKYICKVGFARVSGSFKAYFLSPDPLDLANIGINAIANELQALAKNHEITVKNLLEVLFHSKLDSDGHIVNAFSETMITEEERNNILKAGIMFLLSVSILRKEFYPINHLGQTEWLKELHLNLKNEMQILDENLVKQIQNHPVKIKYELTYSMMLTESFYRNEWHRWTGRIVHVAIEPQGNRIEHLRIEIEPSNEIDLRTIFKLLQSILYFSHGKVKCIVPIGGAHRVFYLSRAAFGDSQILVETKNGDWPGTPKQGKFEFWAPDYNTIIDVLKKFPNQELLAAGMIEACTSLLDNQPNFATHFNAITTRHIVEFLVITMVAEAASPTDLVKKAFIEEVAKSVHHLKRFPDGDALPQVGNIRVDMSGSGRSPTIDDVALGKLMKMKDRMNIVKDNIENVFSDDNYPVRKKGGTEEGRKYIYAHGEGKIPPFWISRNAREIVKTANYGYMEFTSTYFIQNVTKR